MGWVWIAFAQKYWQKLIFQGSEDIVRTFICERLLRVGFAPTNYALAVGQFQEDRKDLSDGSIGKLVPFQGVSVLEDLGTDDASHCVLLSTPSCACPDVFVLCGR